MTSDEVKRFTAEKEDVQGNASKYASYAEAFARMKRAQTEGFYLEAITIAESVISDRLVSYLARPTAEKPLEKRRNGTWPEFFRLIDAWREDGGELAERVNEWRDRRNKAVHQIAKSDPGEPTRPIGDFLEEVMNTAKEGEELSRAVCDWHRQQKAKGS